MDFISDKGTGYLYCYKPDHYCANKAGKVLEHVYVMAEHIKRPLLKGECVHHKDRDRTNNCISNLRLMTLDAHTKLHHMEDRGVVYVDVNCLKCDITFTKTERNDRKYCSAKCAKEGSRKFEITKEELELLIWQMPTTDVAKILGVSDVAVAKRCKKLNIPKPPRGYWAKVYSKYP